MGFVCLFVCWFACGAHLCVQGIQKNLLSVCRAGRANTEQANMKGFGTIPEDLCGYLCGQPELKVHIRCSASGNIPLSQHTAYKWISDSSLDDRTKPFGGEKTHKKLFFWIGLLADYHVREGGKGSMVNALDSICFLCHTILQVLFSAGHYI